MTDATGATPATYAYSAFGSTRASTGSLANEVRFTGERTDTESGLEFLRARTYDPSTGTFLQRDSWGISPTDGQSIDAYVYTANNPANAVDPSGHCIQAAAAGTVAGPEGTLGLGAVCVGVLGAILIGTYASGQIAAHPDWAQSAAGVTYTVVSAPVGIAADWVRAGQGWLGGGGESFYDRIQRMTKAKSQPRVEPYVPNPPAPYNPDPETHPVPPGSPFKGFPPAFKKVAKALLGAFGLSTVGNLLFGEDYPSSTPSPTPNPTPSPKSSSAPTPAPSAGMGWRSRVRML